MEDQSAPHGLPGLDVKLLRELFRNLVAFRSFYEATGQDYINGPTGDLWSLWDLERLYALTSKLSTRQRQSIDMCLILGYREVDAAVAMGLSPTNPVAMYATDGLRKIVVMANSGHLEPPESTEVAS